MNTYIVSTQVMENYGAHQEPIEQYWKMKGGNDYRVKADRYPNAMAKVFGLCSNDEYFKEYPVAAELEQTWLHNLETDAYDDDYKAFILKYVKDVD